MFLLLPFLFNQSSFALLYIGNIQMKHLCQAGPAVGALIDPPRLPWSVYAYSPNGFARERPIMRNTNVTGYHFSKWYIGNKFSLFFLYFSWSLNPCPNTILFQFSLLCRSMRSLFGLQGTLSWRWPSILGNCMVVRTLVMMMMMIVVVVMVVKVQSQLWAISQEKGISGDLADKQTQPQQSIAYFLFLLFLSFFSF